VTIAENRIRADLGRAIMRSAPRNGVMLHYDASVTDRGALEWLVSPKCKLGYNFLVWDDGRVFEIIDRSKRAPHAGESRSSTPRLPYPPDCANSVFYGVAIAAGGRAGDRATPKQITAVAELCRELFAAHGWPLTDTWRLTSHHLEAWPRKRKLDIPGPDLTKPVMLLSDITRAFAQMRAAA
jgi:N-acetyl-anhydromuramyl-L-alanine amidase AmpD